MNIVVATIDKMTNRNFNVSNVDTPDVDWINWNTNNEKNITAPIGIILCCVKITKSSNRFLSLNNPGDLLEIEYNDIIINTIGIRTINTDTIPSITELISKGIGKIGVFDICIENSK